MAFVILKKDAAPKWKGRDEEFTAELRKHAKGRLPGFACPEWVQVVEGLPVSAARSQLKLTLMLMRCQKTSTGKIQKVELRKMVAKL